MKRVGILTSGGDCQGLNAAIRGVAKALYEKWGEDVEVYGIQDGYRGLIEGSSRCMKQSDFSGILTLGGTILGTSRQPFKKMRVIEEDNIDKVKAMKDNFKKMKLDCLVTVSYTHLDVYKRQGLHCAISIDKLRIGIPGVGLLNMIMGEDMK